MHNDFETWLDKNAGRPWTARLLSLAAAGTATALVGLSVVLMAGLGLPAGELPAEARAPATPAAAANVRYAEALPTVTIVGRREQAGNAELPQAVDTAAFPARPASGDAATVGMSATGDNLRQ
jgi:hypothetical protein